MNDADPDGGDQSTTPKDTRPTGLVDPGFWRERRVLLTGHTGFKGSWLSLWLATLGARVTGLSDQIPTTPSLFDTANVAELVNDTRADVRDAAALQRALDEAEPETVIHMAAQSLVRPSFADPRATYETNVMGTVNLLDAIRQSPTPPTAVLIVTSDKCYDNREWEWGYREDEPMGGHDPYSNSKGCAELVTDAFRRSFFSAPDSATAVASARAGNVIGGGDWALDRLVPDIMRGALAGEPIRIRNPNALRPWQHVLNPLSGYLVLAQALHTTPTEHATGFNFGPADEDTRPVSWLADRITEKWPDSLEWRHDPGPHPHEATYLKLDSSRARARLNWRPAWDLADGLDSTVEWYQALKREEDMRAVTGRQIQAFQYAAASA
jgi:CDP-glucose 4,6-dehydratase